MIEQRLQRVRELALANDHAGLAAQAAQLLERLGFSQVHLVVLGEFNRGKSTLVNALVGEPLLPTDIVPTTAAVWTVERGDELAVERVAPDGAVFSVEPEPDILAELSAAGRFADGQTRLVRAMCPSLAIGDDVVIIDTPGVNDINEQRAEITYGYLGSCDAAIFVMDASSPVTRSEAEFLETQVLSSDVDRMIFVLNKADRLDEEEIEDSIDAAEERLRELLGTEPRLVALDAERILAARMKGDDECANRWGWTTLGRRVDELLEGVRGADRSTKLERRVSILEGRLATGLKQRIAMLRADAQERTKGLQRFEESLEGLREGFSALEDYVEANGRLRAHQMVRQSFDVSMGQFLENQKVRVSGMMGGIGEYAKRTLPLEIRLFVKRWFEARGPELERFLHEFSEHVAVQYTQYFESKLSLQLGAHPLLPRAQEVEPNVIAGQSSNHTEYVVRALPAVGGLGAMFLLSGPFVLVGAAAGAVAGHWLQKQKAEEARDQLVSDLRQITERGAEPAMEALGSHIDDWFGGFVQSLRTQLEEEVDRVRLGFDSVDPSWSPETTESVAKELEKNLRLLPAAAEEVS